jgi:hypothetical protein
MDGFFDPPRSRGTRDPLDDILGGHQLPDGSEGSSVDGAPVEESASEAPKDPPCQRWVGSVVLAACVIAGAVIALGASVLASYLLCKAVIALLNGVFGLNLLYPLAGSWIIDGIATVVGLTAAVVAYAAAGSKFKEPVLRAIDWKTGPVKYDPELWWYEREAFECGAHGIAAAFLLRLWVIVGTTLQLLWSVTAFHVVVLVIIVVVPIAVALIVGAAFFISMLLCSIVIWVLNCIPAVAIPFPLSGNWIVNAVVIVLTIPMTVVVILCFAAMGKLMEEHPFLAGLAIGWLAGSSRDSSRSD